MHRVGGPGLTLMANLSNHAMTRFATWLDDLSICEGRFAVSLLRRAASLLEDRPELRAWVIALADEWERNL